MRSEEWVVYSWDMETHLRRFWRRIGARMERWTRFEFWPGWIVYPLLIPTWVRGALRTGRPMAFTACNPGIEAGGGVVGESKYAIMAALRRDAERAGLPRALAEAVCETHLIEPGEPAERARRVEELGASDDDPAGAAGRPLDRRGMSFPLILKPDAGYRGFSVRRISSRTQAEDYFRMMPRPALAQALHAGPGEVGVVWVREIGQSGKAVNQQMQSGRIFSITLKEFPVLVGDGEHSIEELIWRHPRWRLQASVFFERWRGRLSEVLPAGERLPLAMAGNHCQGALFRDGAHLITPELEAAVDAIASCFRGRATEPSLDMCRLDIRYGDEAALARGELEPNSIVELNGTLGESTNIYDPDKPVSWSLGVLREQWRLMYDLGGARARAGVEPMSMLGFAWVIVKNYWWRRGSGLAD